MDALAVHQGKYAAWLKCLYQHANKPDQNLGAHTIGPSVCRMTLGSACALLARLRELCPDASVFVDLGCGRGLVCATASAVQGIVRVVGWDINADEVAWARREVLPAYGRGSLLRDASGCTAVFDEGDVRQFCLHRDVYHAIGAAANVFHAWVLAFDFDWGFEVRREVHGHLLREDGEWLGVLACSDGDLLTTCSFVRHRSKSDWVFDEAEYERLTGAYEPCGKLSVSLSGSGEGKTLYFYRHK